MFPSPYGEVGFDQTKIYTFNELSYEFPSPYGEVGFDLMYAQLNKIESLSFRPLTGKLVLILFSSSIHSFQRLMSFRPLTGKLVLISAKA